MLNNVALIGRLTKDPELKTVKNDVSVANFTLAVDRPRYGQNEKKTDFIPIVTWRKTADFVSQYYKKGMQVYVLGRLVPRSWLDADGIKRYAYDIEVYETGFADSKKSDHENNASDEFYPPDEFIPDFSDDEDYLPN